MTYSIIVLCAGSGTRSGLHYNKMLYQFQGTTIYEMTLKTFIEDESCSQIIVVTKPEEREIFQKLIHNHKIIFVDGGKERQDSVYAGLQEVTNDYVLIHDGARPYVKKESIQSLLECLNDHHACLLMVPCKDTIKIVKEGKVDKTLNRNELMQAQTPQAFMTSVILKAYQEGIKRQFQATDDAQMVEMFTDEDVYAIMGDYENKKITTKDDLL